MATDTHTHDRQTDRQTDRHTHTHTGDMPKITFFGFSGPQNVNIHQNLEVDFLGKCNTFSILRIAEKVKKLGTCDALLDISSLVQENLDKGFETPIVQIDFSAAFDLVNHRALVYKLNSEFVVIF